MPRYVASSYGRRLNIRNGRKDSLSHSARVTWPSFLNENGTDGDCKNDGIGVLGRCLECVPDGGGAPTTRGVDREAPGEAKEKDRAVSGEAPTREGLAVGTTALLVVVVLKYHGFSELRWETVTENREEVDPPNLTTPPPPTTGASKRREVALARDEKVRSRASRRSPSTTPPP